MQSLSQLEASAIRQPNSIEINEALADAYARHGRWQEAVKTYRTLRSLYPETAALFIDRIRLGASALMLSSILFFVADLIGPPAAVQTAPALFARAIASREFLVAQILFMLAFALYSCAAISIYKLLSYTPDHRPAFWAMVLSVTGSGLAMPSLGINAVVLPLIGNLFLAGKTDVFDLYFAMQHGPWPYILRLGGYLSVAGLAVFTWVIWRNRTLSLAAVLAYLSGWFASVQTGGQMAGLPLVLTGTLILAGGIALGRSLWIQASTQFDPAMDRSSKS
jgi:hypothetical protein